MPYVQEGQRRVEQKTTRPLAGIRILDLTTVVVGPSCTLRLADYGAEVIKLEAPEGDVLRTLGGPSPSGQHSGKYLAFNRNKRAICLFEVQADRTLVAVERQVLAGVLSARRGAAQGAQHVTLRRLQFDDLGPIVRQPQRAGWPDDHGRQIENADPREWPGGLLLHATLPFLHIRHRSALRGGWVGVKTPSPACRRRRSSSPAIPQTAPRATSMPRPSRSRW